MKKPNTYLSEPFLNHVFYPYASTLKREKSRSNYFSSVSDFCEYIKKDFLKASPDDCKSYFKFLEDRILSGEISYNYVYSKLSSLRSIYSYALTVSKKDNIHVSSPNPFLFVDMEIPNDFINPHELITQEELDLLLSIVREDSLLYTAVSLAIRCALTIKELSTLKVNKNHIKGDGFPFLVERNASYIPLKAPDDIEEIIRQYLLSREHQGEYFFYNKRGGTLSIRLLQKRLQDAVEKTSLFDTKSVTFQDLRNYSITLMLNGGATIEEIAPYVGISTKWLTRYEYAAEEITLSPGDYNNIIIKPFLRAVENSL